MIRRMTGDIARTCVACSREEKFRIACSLVDLHMDKPHGESRASDNQLEIVDCSATSRFSAKGLNERA